jgi:hypothetical protein
VRRRMTEEELTREETVAINLNDILYYLQSQRKFLELHEHKRPSDELTSRQIRVRHHVEEDTPEFLGYLKRIDEAYERKEELARLVASFGNSREQVLRNIGRMVRTSPKIMRSYEDFLERNSNPHAYPEIRGAETWRIRPQTLEGKVGLGPLDLCESGGIPQIDLYAMGELDKRYCNAYPGTSD